MFQNVNLSLLSFSKADAKVEDFNIPTKYIFHFFLIFLKLFCNWLISKDVVEHMLLKVLYLPTK
ncbi:conserved domain protein [Bacteroides clarus YIT 12056]|uniref:Conserved domain protein n=1 Tax=Bacteroides clarus YIT 12056 TaxID=762984 RepID=A0ABP2KLI9_9BACE|nr:conserved domain protein [Bacteroides clarus YIT 12056]